MKKKNKMKKKKIIIIFCVLIILIFLLYLVFSNLYKKSEFIECFSYSNNGLGITITGYDEQCLSDSKNVLIPKEIDGSPVLEIGNQAFYDIDIMDGLGIKNVIIPDTVKVIGELAFAENDLTNVIIPDSVTTIKNNAFMGNKLKSVIISKNVDVIKSDVFRGNKLSSVIIPNGVKEIHYGAFAENRLEKIIIPKSVELIDDNAFEDNDFKSIIIPDGVLAIGDYAFAGNSLTNITISESVKEIGAGAFTCACEYPIGHEHFCTYMDGEIKIINKAGKDFNWRRIIFGNYDYDDSELNYEIEYYFEKNIIIDQK